MTSTDGTIDFLDGVDLTRMTMTSGVSSSGGTFGAVAHLGDGAVPTFVLRKACVVKEITKNDNLVLLVTNPLDRDALLKLQDAFVVLLCALMPMPNRLTCTDALSMVRHVVGRMQDGDGVHVLVCVARDSSDATHLPTRVHLRHSDNCVERDVGFGRLREGQYVYPVFHAPGASLDPMCDRLVPHVTVGEIVICCKEEEFVA